jgi:hypothetical protein
MNPVHWPPIMTTRRFTRSMPVARWRALRGASGATTPQARRADSFTSFESRVQCGLSIYTVPSLGRCHGSKALGIGIFQQRRDDSPEYLSRGIYDQVILFSFLFSFFVFQTSGNQDIDITTNGYRSPIDNVRYWSLSVHRASIRNTIAAKWRQASSYGSSFRPTGS